MAEYQEYIEKINKQYREWKSSHSLLAENVLDNMLENLKYIDAHLKQYIIEIDGDELTDIQAIELIKARIDLFKYGGHC